MSSTFLTRLRVGEISSTRKAYRGSSRVASACGRWRCSGSAGLGAIVVAVVLSPGVHHLIELIVLRIRDWLGLG